MANIFTKTNDWVKSVKRNTFDGSFQNNLTMQFGGLYPVFCKEVIPGDSFKIRPTFALKFMPLVFPVQTRMRANLHFFYVRNRPLWKDWPDFIGKTKDGLESPYLAPTNQADYNAMFTTGSLGDYLGLPTTVVGGLGRPSVFKFLPNQDSSGKPIAYIEGNTQASTGFYNVGNWISAVSSGSPAPSNIAEFYDELDGFSSAITRTNMKESTFIGSSPVVQMHSVPTNMLNPGSSYWGYFLMNVYYLDLQSPLAIGDYFSLKVQGKYPDCLVPILMSSETNDGTTQLKTTRLEPWSGSEGIDLSGTLIAGDEGSERFNGSRYFWFGFLCPYYYTVPSTLPSNIPVNLGFKSSSAGDAQNTPQAIILNGARINSVESGQPSYITWDSQSFNPDLFPTLTMDVRRASSDETSTSEGEVTDTNFSNAPYWYTGNDDEERIKVSALPFRAYESIYNSFYRDARNNPYILNGVAEYNKWIPTDAGGADANVYKLRFRNWEPDFLTTAVPTPQQGIAPLVGMSSTGEMTFEDENGKQYKAQATFAEDGNTIQGIKVQSPDMPAGNMRALVDMVSSGISINDFRNVNSLQRWLETNIRRGLKYRDQIKSHYDVDISYQELDMPEFIGGTSEDVVVNQISQSTPTEATPLGWFAGQANCVGTSKNAITHYCDEHGFIIGILSVTPVPNYSQLIPKFFLKRDTLDYFFPEFGHIGMQPIFQKEVTPLQAYYQGKADKTNYLNDTFGYQRAWYDYLQNVDEVHGLFRTQLHNFLINRVFDQLPALSEDFLLVDPEQVNQVFSVTDTTDKILGQVYFDVVMKRPIPMFGIPRLE